MVSQQQNLGMGRLLFEWLEGQWWAEPSCLYHDCFHIQLYNGEQVGGIEFSKHTIVKVWVGLVKGSRPKDGMVMNGGTI